MEGKFSLLRLDQVIGGDSSTAKRTVREILEEKHPNASPSNADAILCDDPTNDVFHPILFDSITAEVIRVFALHVEGSAGPSWVDAMAGDDCAQHLVKSPMIFALPWLPL